MSLENSIALLTEQVGLARDQMAGITAVATAQINAVGASYNQIVASQSLTLFVDWAGGSDANSGLVVGSPLKTIQAAINKCPRGGAVRILLMSDYVMQQNVYTSGRNVSIAGHNGVKRRIDFVGSAIATTPIYRVSTSFLVTDGGGLGFRNVALAIPELGALAAYALANGGLIGHAGADYWVAPQIAFYSCDIIIPAQPLCPVFYASNAWIVNMISMTYPGAITSPLGRLFLDQPNTAGVAAASLPWLLTNLTTV